MAAPQDMADDERHYQYHHCDQRVVGVGGDVVVDRVDVVAGHIADGHPGSDPQSGTDDVEEDETAPVHAADAGDDPVRLAQALDEPCNHDDLAAVPVEKDLSLVQSLLGQEDVSAPSQGQRTAAEMPDGEADVVPDDGRDEAHDRHRHDVEPACARKDRGGDEYGLAGHRDPEVLDQDQEQDGPVSVVVELAAHHIEETRQLRWRVICQCGSYGGQHRYDRPSPWR